MTKTSRGLVSLLAAVLLLAGCAAQAPKPVVAGGATPAATVSTSDGTTPAAQWDPAEAPAPASPATATASIRTDAPVIVVGAGLSGLTIAYELKKAGIEALLLESSPRVGGRIQTVTFPDGATAEGHMEEYFARSPAYPLLVELGLPLIDDVAHSTVRIDGKIYPYQGEGDRDTYLRGIFDENERAAFLRWNDKAWKLYEVLHASHSAGTSLPAELVPLTKISFKDFVEGDQLPHKVSEWIRVTVEPEMAIEWDQISALDGIDEVRLFLDTPDGFGEMNYHVKGGNTDFTTALARRLDPGQIVTDARVTAVEQDAGRVKVRALLNDARYVEITGRMVVVTAPISQIGRIQFTPPLDPGKRRAIDSERMGSYIKVHFRMAPGASKLWTVDGENILTLLSDSLAGSIYDVTDLQHADGGVEKDGVLTLLLHARFARELMNKPADEIRERTADALEALFPGARGYIKSAEIFVYPQAVANWPLELGRSRFDDLANELRRPQGRLYIGGDTTEDSHSEGAVVSALRIAKDIVRRRAELQ
ncbi:MAG TPA: NAD(P)/FAD-dependent oxidoreductase [Thermoanaerobaculia bacterium]|nr:NAD(P)/FAD-dependent oxidoreductase [Thermoanaerobaculia bacterium]